jgi:hypothetical protein
LVQVLPGCPFVFPAGVELGRLGCELCDGGFCGGHLFSESQVLAGIDAEFVEGALEVEPPGIAPEPGAKPVRFMGACTGNCGVSAAG